MLRRSGLHLLPGLRCVAAACNQAVSVAPSACQGTTGLAPWPAAGGLQPAPDVCWQQQWQLGSARTAGSSSSVSDSGDGTSGRLRRGRLPRTAEPQPELQAWLERQGLPAAEAEQHARCLVAVFGSNQQAALASLPATFGWCRGKGLTGLETAQLLDRIASYSRENVSNFAATAQRIWQLMDDPITAYVQRRQQPNKRQPKHSSLAGVLRSNRFAALSLGTPPGHVEAWLAAVGKRLPHADLGRLLLTNPAVVTIKPDTALAAITWLGDTLKIEVKDLAAFVAANPSLLMVPLEANFKELQQTLQLPAEHVRLLVLRWLMILTSSNRTVHAAAGWLGQLFDDAEQRLALLERCPELLAASTDRLQRNASYLQRELGWQPGSGELAAFVDDYPVPFAQLDFEGEETQAKLLLFAAVVGAERRDVLRKWSSYLHRARDYCSTLHAGAEAGTLDAVQPKRRHFPDLGSARHPRSGQAWGHQPGRRPQIRARVAQEREGAAAAGGTQEWQHGGLAAIGPVARRGGAAAEAGGGGAEVAEGSGPPGGQGGASSPQSARGQGRAG